LFCFGQSSDTRTSSQAHHKRARTGKHAQAQHQEAQPSLQFELELDTFEEGRASQRSLVSNQPCKRSALNNLCVSTRARVSTRCAWGSALNMKVVYTTTYDLQH